MSLFTLPVSGVLCKYIRDESFIIRWWWIAGYTWVGGWVGGGRGGVRVSEINNHWSRGGVF